MLLLLNNKNKSEYNYSIMWFIISIMFNWFNETINNFNFYDFIIINIHWLTYDS